MKKNEKIVWSNRFYKFYKVEQKETNNKKHGIEFKMERFKNLKIT